MRWPTCRCVRRRAGRTGGRRGRPVRRWCARSRRFRAGTRRAQPEGATRICRPGVRGPSFERSRRHAAGRSRSRRRHRTRRQPAGNASGCPPPPSPSRPRCRRNRPRSAFNDVGVHGSDRACRRSRASAIWPILRRGALGQLSVAMSGRRASGCSGDPGPCGATKLDQDVGDVCLHRAAGHEEHARRSAGWSDRRAQVGDAPLGWRQRHPVVDADIGSRRRTASPCHELLDQPEDPLGLLVVRQVIRAWAARRSVRRGCGRPGTGPCRSSRSGHPCGAAPASEPRSSRAPRGCRTRRSSESARPSSPACSTGAASGPSTPGSARRAPRSAPQPRSRRRSPTARPSPRQQLGLLGGHVTDGARSQQDQPAHRRRVRRREQRSDRAALRQPEQNGALRADRMP